MKVKMRGGVLLSRGSISNLGMRAGQGDRTVLSLATSCRLVAKVVDQHPPLDLMLLEF